MASTPGLHARAYSPGSYTRGHSGPMDPSEDTFHCTLNPLKPNTPTSETHITVQNFGRSPHSASSEASQDLETTVRNHPTHHRLALLKTCPTTPDCMFSIELLIMAHNPGSLKGGKPRPTNPRQETAHYPQNIFKHAQQSQTAKTAPLPLIWHSWLAILIYNFARRLSALSETKSDLGPQVRTSYCPLILFKAHPETLNYIPSSGPHIRAYHHKQLFWRSEWSQGAQGKFCPLPTNPP